MYEIADSRERGTTPRFSIVICTDGRASALRNTLDSLRFLEYDEFEVCIVHGPTEDGTRELLEEYEGQIKVASNPTRNLSTSRNIGIALAAGEIVAFLDDDAIPEPEWLRDLAASYADPGVGGAGGVVYDHTGANFQYRFGTANRMGRANLDWKHPVPELCFPYTSNFPHLLGVNSSFRRDALLSVGGFDEEYEYYLDETDVTCRLIDAGWLIEQVDGAYVHHKFLPSSVRDEHRVVRHWYPVVKNKIYYSLRHSFGHHGVQEAIDDSRQFVEQLAGDLSWAISQGYLDETDRTRFWQEVDNAWAHGLPRGLSGKPRLTSEETLRHWASPFLPFPLVTPEIGRRIFCFLSQDYPPGTVGGVGRYTHELARGIAAQGHHVHVLTKGEGHDRVDFEEGVWVHRLPTRAPGAAPPGGMKVPSHIWAHASTMASELDAISAKRPITAVCAPIWDCEGIAILTDGRYPLVTTLQTTLRSWLVNNPALAKDPAFVRDFIQPMLKVEARLMLESDAVMAISEAIAHEIEGAYDIHFAREGLAFIPLGLEDWTEQPSEPPPSLAPGSLRLLFVGRLEERKGIDVLLSAAKRVLARYPHVHLDIVGNDTIPGPKGHPWREVFEADEAADAVRARVAFHGEVSESRLRGFYQACDIFVAPSRFESFGLMLVEGMMFGKPVIGGNAGGMVEVVENGQTGLLAEPGDDASLQACLERLIEDADLRARMGIAARRRYEHEFTAKRMAADVAHLLARVGNELSEVKMSGHRSRSIPAAISLPTVVESTANRPVTSKAVIVAPLLARYDAISAAARDTYRMLASALNLHTTVLTYRNDFPDVPAHTVSGVGDLLTHPAFLEADLIIYHFGIYNELCNALIVGNGKARQVVQFHNITPARFVSSAQVQLIKESFRQISNLQYADEVWSDSDVNTEVLKEHGIARERIQAMPLAVDEPGLASLSDKRESPLELLFIGRIVPAKGVLDLVQAVDLARRHSRLQFRVQLAGSLEWSDQEYLRQVKDYVGQHRLDDIVQFCGAVDDRERERLFHAAHVFMIPSYHEGFCKPVIEALRSGCIPVGYASYNLPPITNGFGRLVAPGDIGALAGALVEVLEGIATAMRAQDEPALPLDHGLTSLRDLDAARRAYVEQFTFDRLASMRINRVRALLAGEETLFPDPEFWEVDYNVHRRLALPSS